MTWILFALGVAAGLGLLVWARSRVRRLRPIPEAAPTRRLGELESGRFRVSGRVVALDSTRSNIDEVPCVFLEHAEYRSVGSDLVPVMREVEHGVWAHPFYIDDGSGRLWIDPSEVLVDAVTVFEDSGLSAERRLRAGEEVELIATFAPSRVESDGGPYRASQMAWQPIADDCGPPRISYRTAPDMVTPTDDVTAFIRAAGVLTCVLTVLFSALSFL